MSLLPPRFQEPLMAGPLGPVTKPAPAVPELHVHDWRPSAASKDHVTCSCGQVSLREFVMPPEVKMADDGQDADWAGFRAPPKVTYSDSVWEMFKREDACR